MVVKFADTQKDKENKKAVAVGTVSPLGNNTAIVQQVSLIVVVSSRSGLVASGRAISGDEQQFRHHAASRTWRPPPATSDSVVAGQW